MKTLAIFGMIITGLSCFSKIGTETLFIEKYSWIWFVVGVLWIVDAISLAFNYNVERK